MKWVLISLAVIAGLVLLIALIGWLLPKGHVASAKADFKQSPEALWNAITDVESFTSWRSDLKKVERLPDRDGHAVWREWNSGGEMTLETTSANPPNLLVMRIADENLPFGGTWSYEISRAGDVTSLKITENGEVYNPIFRFMARFIFGHHSTIETYLKNLGRKFGETPQPIRL